MKRFLVFLLLLISFFGCARLTEIQKLPIVPYPSQIISSDGNFVFNQQTRIIYDFENKKQSSIADYLATTLKKSTGYPFEFEKDTNNVKSNYISFNYIKDEQLGQEGYELTISPSKILIEANEDAGLFYAVQTLLQLLPPEVYSNTKVNNVNWSVKCLHVRDLPRYKWRGMHLDVARHFFPKEFIKTYLDILAMHKINIFHWHLTDDQGWRIEIKKYPKLTSVGAWRVDRENQEWNKREPAKPGEKATYGGYYTQDDIKEIVEYAKDRFITIVPEIEMPAHAMAALAAYPQFSCTGGPFQVPVGQYWPITNIFCAGNDSTFIFLQNVLDEVIKLFPGKYIHVGGDEADKSEWKKCPKCQARIKSEHLKDEAELQSYFMKRIEKFLISRGKKLIGWDEILEGGLAPEATVMSWRGIKGGIEAARSGHDVVMTPTTFCYFDYYQGDPETEPKAIGGNLPLEKVYSFEPTPTDSLTEDQSKHILGGQANLWTEYVPTPSHAEYMLLPRLAALAEDVWTPKELKNYKSFLFRVNELVKKYEQLGWNYSKTNLDD
ncbi:beta-N-acetylhexosaminidase [Melioribacteraceae bacterium 4301-Me]|uniref:beta-N-acetylhexosaminidase n=1 Tax=Pyranulibacter aquaticus TaxID=3163344 RepID=UPI00359B01F8